jgi:hypothetical protein
MNEADTTTTTTTTTTTNNNNNKTEDSYAWNITHNMESIAA